MFSEEIKIKGKKKRNEKSKKKKTTKNFKKGVEVSRIFPKTRSFPKLGEAPNEYDSLDGPAILSR